MPADRPDPRARMLAEAEAIRDAYATDLEDARTERDNLRAELAKIQRETAARVSEISNRITDLAALRADAAGLVRSLTPRKSSKAAPGVEGFGPVVHFTAEDADADSDQ